ncbi:MULTISPECIES: M6 family metalloprotease domain-containing protein [unclassified Streptomyces]|uniref:M6 family metalloprotease domain-containing protein n=1 Tax=unclassified Streptomyces TaxID=2593676 RepID=UPI0016613A90|nr:MULTISPECIES: M6 family metalloprotease domain-containing protein [unclassified Streptomyces]MBD0709403.1 M6 family metalloprotease domain-containing protein [Streptomyces sp. CBMA291]MBD0713834.1 M6 family metalloprotease domain-containing protein [Streptomyces sp. CBMA370]
MQHPRRRIRGRAALAASTALSLAFLASASGTLPGPAPASAGPVAAAPEGAQLGPCRIATSLGVQMSEGLPTAPGYVHSTGRVRALNLMVDFPDAPGDGTAMGRFREFFPRTADWFRTSSYGRLRYLAEAPIPDWLRMPKAFAAYGIERGSPFEPGYRSLVEDIVKAADSRIDFSAYDLVNVLVTPNAGPSALDTVLSVTFSGNDDAPYADGVPLANTSFVYSRQDDGSGSYPETGYRVLPHENGHVFGLPDLYTPDGGGTVGHWDIMSEDWGANNDLLGWHKWKLGWLDNEQIGCAARPGSADWTLTPLAEPGGPKLVFVPLSGTSGYAVEVRGKGGNDEAVCEEGVLVYRVESDVDTGHGPVTVADSRRASGGCTHRANVHAELSDAPYRPGETFTDRAHGIRITVLDESEDGTYRVRVTRH